MSSPGSEADAVRMEERLIRRISVEISARDKEAIPALTAHFEPGTEVSITFLPRQDPLEIVRAAKALVEAGFVPVPHVVAREIASVAVFEDFVARLTGEAGVTQVLCVGGDEWPGRGAFGNVLEMLEHGALLNCGLQSVWLAGHPEGIAGVDGSALEHALEAKIGFLAVQGIEPRVVTQFVFDEGPILTFLARLKALGVEVPVRIGLAGPASPATLLRYAAICGVGASMKVMQKHALRFGRTAMAAGPDAIVSGVSRALSATDSGQLEGIHVFPFGGVARAGTWRQERLKQITEGGT